MASSRSFIWLTAWLVLGCGGQVELGSEESASPGLESQTQGGAASQPGAPTSGSSPTTEETTTVPTVDPSPSDPVTTTDPSTPTNPTNPSQGPVCSTQLHQGEGTYYAWADGGGNCSFPPTPDDFKVAAMNQIDYADAAACGACAAVKGPKGSITVRIVDRCPECKPGDLDFSIRAFTAIADQSAGRVRIEWTYVPCDHQGPIRFMFKEGSSQYWTAIQVRNHLNAVKSLEIKGPGGQYTQLRRENYNYFVAQGGLGQGPFDFRVTDTYGSVLEEEGIALRPGQEVPGQNQFPACTP